MKKAKKILKDNLGREYPQTGIIPKDAPRMTANQAYRLARKEQILVWHKTPSGRILPQSPTPR